MTAVWRLERGANVLEDGAARFSVWAPNASRVAVRIGPDGTGGTHELEPRDGGVHEATLQGLAPGTRYVYVLDDDREVPDPVSRSQPEDVHGPSELVDPGEFSWTDSGWRGLAMPDYVIYELHVGTFTEAGTFDAAAAQLPVLRELGVTAIEIMPVAEFPGGRNWGYDGVSLYAPESAYGGPEGLRRLVDAAHELGIAVLMDVVYNHLGPEGNYLGAFGPYFTENYRTPWGQAVNFDGADSDEVRRFVIDNALYWITEFHIDGLRLDAVHRIFDFSAYHILHELTDAVHRQGERLGRQVVVIAESDLNDPRLVRPAARGGYTLDAQWSDDFHHAVHAELTGERDGYYAEFGGVGPIAKALAERFVFDGRYAESRRRRHGAPATDVPADRFVVCIQNHDQIGNRATGDRLVTILSFEQHRLAAALLLLSPYVPLLFMGEEYGETNPFPYFVSHTDAELVEAVRRGRREEFAAFGWAEDVPDPQAEETFRSAKLDRAKVIQPAHAAVFALYRELIRVRREQPALRPGDAEVTVEHDDAERWMRMEFGHRSGADLVALFNLSDIAQELLVDAASGGRWTLRFSTSDERFRGPAAASDQAARSAGSGEAVRLPAYSAVLYAREGGTSRAFTGALDTHRDHRADETSRGSAKTERN